MHLEHPSPVTKFILCAGILLVGLVIAWRSLQSTRRPLKSPFEERLGHRPWRRTAAGIVMLLAIMFVVGVYVVDIPDRPVPYAVYWIIMLGLVVWLCAVAVRDLLHTRRTLARWRKERDPLSPTHERANAKR